MNEHAEYVCEGSVQVSTGGYVAILKPDPVTITIEDIAHSLANTGRFTGHTKVFYPTAQHCVLGSYKAPNITIAWEFLFHDGAEAFIGDVASPLKSQLPDYKRIERTMDAAVAEQMNCTYPMVQSVKRLDLEALATERRDLMPSNDDELPWACLEGVHVWPEKINPWHPLYAEYRFLKRAKELDRDNWELIVPNPVIPCFIQAMQMVSHFLLKSLA